jgi:hypothetical protein
LAENLEDKDGSGDGGIQGIEPAPQGQPQDEVAVLPDQPTQSPVFTADD